MAADRQRRVRHGRAPAAAVAPAGGAGQRAAGLQRQPQPQLGLDGSDGGANQRQHRGLRGSLVAGDIDDAELVTGGPVNGNR